MESETMPTNPIDQIQRLYEMELGSIAKGIPNVSGFDVLSTDCGKLFSLVDSLKQGNYTHTSDGNLAEERLGLLLYLKRRQIEDFIRLRPVSKDGYEKTLLLQISRFFQEAMQSRRLREVVILANTEKATHEYVDHFFSDPRRNYDYWIIPPRKHRLQRLILSDYIQRLGKQTMKKNGKGTSFYYLNEKTRNNSDALCLVLGKNGALNNGNILQHFTANIAAKAQMI